MSENASGPVPDDDPTIIVVADGADGADGADDVEATLLVPRPRPTPDSQETVLVSRAATPPDDADTVIVSRPAIESDDADTVIVSRPAVESDDADTVLVARGPAEPDDEDTVSVSTDAPADSVDRTTPDDDDDTVIVAGEADVVVTGAVAAIDDEATIRVDRSASDHAAAATGREVSSAIRPAMLPQRGRRRGELRPAPVPSGFGGVPLVAPGAGAVSSYRVRALVPPSAELAAPRGGAAPERALGGGVSVRRQSRRIAFWALTASAASVVLIAGGMLWAVKDLVGF